MRKEKNSKVKELDHFDNEYAAGEHTAEMMNEFMDSPGTDNTAVQLASAAMSSAIDLAKLVVENRVRNASNMNDDDIYHIYEKSFESVMITATGVHDEH